MLNIFRKQTLAPVTIAVTASSIPSDLFEIRRAHDHVHAPRFYSKSTGRFYQRINGQIVECAPNPIVRAFAS